MTNAGRDSDEGRGGVGGRRGAAFCNMVVKLKPRLRLYAIDSDEMETKP